MTDGTATWVHNDLEQAVANILNRGGEPVVICGLDNQLATAMRFCDEAPRVPIRPSPYAEPGKAYVADMAPVSVPWPNGPFPPLSCLVRALRALHTAP